MLPQGLGAPTTIHAPPCPSPDTACPNLPHASIHAMFNLCVWSVRGAGGTAVEGASNLTVATHTASLPDPPGTSNPCTPQVAAANIFNPRQFLHTPSLPPCLLPSPCCYYTSNEERGREKVAASVCRLGGPTAERMPSSLPTQSTQLRHQPRPSLLHCRLTGWEVRRR